MTDNGILGQLQQLFIRVFNDPQIKINRETTMEDVPAWDSLHNVMLIEEIENAFNVKFELDDMLEIDGIHSIIEKIKQKSG